MSGTPIHSIIQNYNISNKNPISIGVKKTLCITNSQKHNNYLEDAKRQVKTIIKNVPKIYSKKKLVEEENKKNVDKLNKNIIIDYSITPIIQKKNIVDAQIDNTIKLNNQIKLDNILEYTINIINEFKEYEKSINIDIILSKVRLEYENKESFSNNKRIILLNYEDDTFKPVLELEDKYMDIITNLYKNNNLLLDIEETEYYIPEELTKYELFDILYQIIDFKNKEDYLNIYIPQCISYLLNKKSFNNLEKRFYKSKKNEEIKDISDNNLLTELGIIIPENMIYKEDYFYINEDKINYLEENKNKIQLKNRKIFGKMLDSEGNFDILSYNESSNINYDNNDTNKMYLEYNSDYNWLYPSFGDNCELIEEINKKVLNDSPQKSLIIVLFNTIYLQSIVIENPDKDTLYVIRNCSEYGFIELFTLCCHKTNIELSEFIKSQFHQHLFNDIVEINDKISTTSSFIDFNNLHINKNKEDINEEKIVKDFIKYNFNITNNIEDKMKASDLCNLLVQSPAINIDKSKLNGFRNRLSNYLLSIGLKKKRYNDGYYYYGIIEKFENKSYEEIIIERTKMDHEYIIKK